ANVDHSARILALGLGGLAEHGKQRIGFHPALIPPEAQANLAAWTHPTPRLTQGIETIPPDASEARGHIETRCVERQMQHVADLDRSSGRARCRNGREPSWGVETAARGHAFT